MLSFTIFSVIFAVAVFVFFYRQPMLQNLIPIVQYAAFVVTLREGPKRETINWVVPDKVDPVCLLIKKQLLPHVNTMSSLIVAMAFVSLGGICSVWLSGASTTLTQVLMFLGMALTGALVYESTGTTRVLRFATLASMLFTLLADSERANEANDIIKRLDALQTDSDIVDFIRSFPILKLLTSSIADDEVVKLWHDGTFATAIADLRQDVEQTNSRLRRQITTFNEAYDVVMGQGQ